MTEISGVRVLGLVFSGQLRGSLAEGSGFDKYNTSHRGPYIQYLEIGQEQSTDTADLVASVARSF